MNNIEKGSIKYLIIMILTTILIGFIIFPLFDFLLDNFITHKTFTYSVSDHIINPIVIATFMSVVLWLLDRNKK